MNLILLYGPPAVGKLTIAKELRKLTGYTIFDNHMILNILNSIFEYNNPTRKSLEKEFRTRIVEEAIKSDINLIMTGVVINRNIDFYKNVVDLVKVKGGKSFLIQLTASEAVLKNRVADNSRKLNQKIITKKSWDSFYKLHPEIYNKFSETKQLCIDTTKISPKTAAKQIMEHYGLNKILKD